MLYLALFIIATFALSEYFYTIYKESKYYKEDVVSISYVGNSFEDDTKESLKVKEL